jgi:SOS-response transcriptional repressor LexA
VTPSAYLTDIQQRIMAAIRELTDDLGYPPSVREIADAVNLASTSSAWHHRTTLERRGVVTHTPRRSRSWRVVQP